MSAGFLLHAQVVALDLEPTEFLGDPIACLDRALDGVAQGVDLRHPGIELAARLLHGLLEGRDFRSRALHGHVLVLHTRRGFVTLRVGLAAARATALEFLLRGPDALLQAGDLLLHADERDADRLHLLQVEFELLLTATALEFLGMRGLARSVGRSVRLDELDAQAFERGLDFGDAAGESCLVGPRLLQAVHRRGHRRLQRLVLLPEEQLLPLPQFLAQRAIAAGLRGLALQRAALLLEFEDDVVDAGQVLLRGLELQFGLAAPRLVLGDELFSYVQ